MKVLRLFLLVACCFLAILGSETQLEAAGLSLEVNVLPMPKGGDTDVELSSVDCVDPSFCIAVGAFRPNDSFTSYEDEHTVVLRFDGRRWSVMRSPSTPEADLDGVDCVSRVDCVAVGESVNAQGESSPLIEQMRKGAWSVVFSPAPDFYSQNSSHLQAVSCISMNNCTAVGWDNGIGYGRGLNPSTGIVEHGASQGWTLASLAPLTPKIQPQSNGGIEVPTNTFDPTFLMTVSCTSSLCVSAGEQRSFIDHHQGIWTPLAGSPLMINGVTCSGAHACLGVGSDGSGLSDHVEINTTTSIVRLAGTRWVRVSSPNTQSSSNTLNSVACWTLDSCVAVGEYTGPPTDQPQSTAEGGALIAAESNGSWHLLSVPRSTPDTYDILASISCPSSHLCVAVGQSMMNALHVPSGPVRAFSVLMRRP